MWILLSLSETPTPETMKSYTLWRHRSNLASYGSFGIMGVIWNHKNNLDC